MQLALKKVTQEEDSVSKLLSGVCGTPVFMVTYDVCQAPIDEEESKFLVGYIFIYSNQ